MRKKKETRGRPRTLTKRQAEKNNATCREKWRSAHTKIVNVRFNLETDAAILAKLDSVPNKADYIRQLILKDIGK